MLAQAEIVDAGAGQTDRAVNGIAFEIDARAFSERLVDGLQLVNRDHAGRARRRCLGLCLNRSLLGFVFFLGRFDEELLIAHHERDHQHHCEQKIALVLFFHLGVPET